ncbi:MAG: hypothetical protein R3E88_10025 [Myxococcota bacterium]
MGRLRGRLLHWRRLVITYPLFFVATAATGGAASFLYSYIPLHTVEMRKIERLESALLAKEEHVEELEATLASLRTELDAQPDASSLASLEAARDEAVDAKRAAERELDKAQKRVGYLERERAEWKRKIASLESARATPPPVAHAPVDPSRGSTGEPDAEPTAIAPAAPAAIAAPAPSRAVAGAEPPAPMPSHDGAATPASIEP